MSLTRDQILAFASAPRVTEPVECPALGGTVHVRAMTAGDRDRFDEQNSADLFGDFRARLLALAVGDENGRRLFADSDVPALSALPHDAVEPAVAAAMRMNGIGAKADKTEAKN